VAGEGEGERYEVTILRRHEVVTMPKLRQYVTVVLVTYSAAGLPPRTLSIPKEEWSLEREKQLVKRDIERRLKIRPEIYTV